MRFTWGSWKFLRFTSFRFWPLYWNRKLRKLGNIYNTCKFQGMFFTWGGWKFPKFLSFDFGHYTKIENSENSEIFKTLVNFKECVLLEEVRNFRVFRVFDFGPYTEIKNSENSETFSKLVIALLEEVWNFRGFPVFDFTLYAEIENSEYSEFFSRLFQVKWICFVWRKL